MNKELIEANKPYYCSSDSIDNNNPEIKSIIENQMETFELQEIIGYGGESTVYKSIVKKTKRPVTLKVVNNQKKHGKNKAEINIGLKLKNKNVIKLF